MYNEILDSFYTFFIKQSCLFVSAILDLQILHNFYQANIPQIYTLIKASKSTIFLGYLLFVPQWTNVQFMYIVFSQLVYRQYQYFSCQRQILAQWNCWTKMEHKIKLCMTTNKGRSHIPFNIGESVGKKSKFTSYQRHNYSYAPNKGQFTLYSVTFMP